MKSPHVWIRAAGIAVSVLSAGCGSRSALLESDVTDDATTTSTLTATCDLHLDPRPLPSSPPGALCTQQEDAALPGPTMAYVQVQRLYGLTTSGPSEQHVFLEYGPKGTYESSRVIASRGEWVFAGDARTSPSETDGRFVLARRDGQIVAERAILAGPSSFSQLTVTGSASGLMVFSYFAYPSSHILEAISPGGPLPISMEGVDPVTDPDDAGQVAVREYDTTNRLTYWLSLCDGQTRPTQESARYYRTPPVGWGRFMVYLSDDGESLVVEGSDGANSLDIGVPVDPTLSQIIDFHPSGWALVNQLDPTRFLAIHVGTGEVHKIHLVFPPGYQRYQVYQGIEPGPFDPNSRELRVTSTGGVLLALRSASLGYLFVSQDGEEWQSLGHPIGMVYSAKGIEAGGTYLHIGNSYTLDLPAWDPAPPESGRLDFQSVQLYRPNNGQFVVILNPPQGSYYNDIYRLSGDGGCLARRGVSGGDIEWTNAVTAEVFTFPGAPQDSLLPMFTWMSAGDVESASLLSW